MITWQELNRIEADILAVTKEHKQIVIDHTLTKMLEAAELLRNHGLLGYVGYPDSQLDGATTYEITREGRAFYGQWGNPDAEKTLHETNLTNELLQQIKTYKNQLAKLANLAESLDRQLVTRDDGILESMYSVETSLVRDNLSDAIQETWIMLSEVVEE